MPTGIITNELVDDFPETTRPGSGVSGNRTTDVDIALNTLVEHFNTNGTSPVLKVLDYNLEYVDAANPELGTREVESKLARQRAGGRIPQIKSRGYSVENGWQVKARNGAVYARYFGPGNVPEEPKKKVGEEIPV